MNCPNCGTSNLENTTICVNCGRPMAGGGSYAPPPPPPQQQASYTPPPTPTGVAAVPIPNYLWQSIVVTIVCCTCFPLGIVAIIFAAQVNDKLRRGDIQGAMQASKNAKLWCWITFGVGLLIWIVWFATSSAAIMEAIREAQAQANR